MKSKNKLCFFKEKMNDQKDVLLIT